MDFDIVLFLKVVAVLTVHAAFLYFIFRQLDKLFGVKQ